jgi:G:T/U-mismatch repair DNA glycosylase
MKKQPKYSPEFIERAVRMVSEAASEYSSQWASIESIAAKISRTPNDFERLHRLCPELETVGFNGQTSGKFAPQFAAQGYRTVVLPSSSPAHMAMSCLLGD